MPVFSYQTLNSAGDVLTGRIDAVSELAALEQLKKSGATVVDISVVKPSMFSSFSEARKKKVTVADLMVFTRQLATMIDAGIPLMRTVRALSEQVENPTLAEVLKSVGIGLEAGNGFADSLAAHPKVFPAIYVDLVRAGESGGTLVTSLTRLAVQLEQEKTLKDNVKSAMFYPVLIMGFALIILISMMIFIVPVFIEFFPPGLELPVLTRFTVGASNSLRNQWYLWLATIVLLVVGVRYFLASPTGRRVWDRIKFKIPVFGSLGHKTMVARFSRTLSTLIEGGIPILTALETAGPTSGSMLVADAVKEAGEKIQEGQSIAQPLQQSGLFPPMVIHMISVGEESGSLPALLARVADFYESEVAAMTKALTSLIEPIMLVIIGLMVGVIVISIYLPMFTVVTSVGK